MAEMSDQERMPGHSKFVYDKATRKIVAVDPNPTIGDLLHQIDHEEAVGWAILQALHENVPEAERPMSWSDMKGDQEIRIRAAARAAIAAYLQAEPQEGWRAMESEEPPKDGTKIDLLYPYPRGRTIDCYWDASIGGVWASRRPSWRDFVLLPESEWDLSTYPNMEPTHWRPAPVLPAPPTTEER